MARTILFVTKSTDDSATRYRARVLFPTLEARGWRVLHVAGDAPGFRLVAGEALLYFNFYLIAIYDIIVDFIFIFIL